ncbi:hypothetical protein Kfla_6207 [Kribbella flavida DSM 17836]|uniref:DUF4263 domain-containing protein n=1 Tax=Kribbella flavida (strain DSM 17836 / JCM 10339 / NBRC 14399) TaxID=479435 RepID=D2PVH0_KRIFD|nr:hypothetical protein [Kribbella flavida]ADB35210.1 hypothetical protein Kfla_6207 [Kribbella flavida DSM 17836]
MKPTEFVKVNSQFWGEHLKGVSDHLPTSHRRELPGPLLYPRMMVLTETPDWNILELVGVSREYRSLEVKRQKAESIDEYFGAGGSSAAEAVVVLPDESFVKDATIASERGRSVFGDNFVEAARLIGNELVGPSEKLLQFAPGNYVTLQRVLLAQSAGSAVRLHWTFLAIAIHRSEPADKYREFLQRLVNSAEHLDPVGTFSVAGGEAEQLLKAAPFASTYLHDLQKLTTAEFLNQHEEILLSAFGATRVIAEPFLEWQDGTPGADEVAVTPDFILERADGSHVVGDLALAVLETSGGKKRRRSLGLRDGAERLARFQEYFAGPENRAFVQAKYGVEVTDPRTVLIVGSPDLPVDFHEATHATAVEVVDYDTLLQIYLASKS